MQSRQLLCQEKRDVHLQHLAADISMSRCRHQSSSDRSGSCFKFVLDWHLLLEPLKIRQFFQETGRPPLLAMALWTAGPENTWSGPEERILQPRKPPEWECGDTEDPQAQRQKFSDSGCHLNTRLLSSFCRGASPG